MWFISGVGFGCVGFLVVDFGISWFEGVTVGGGGFRWAGVVLIRFPGVW